EGGQLGVGGGVVGDHHVAEGDDVGAQGVSVDERSHRDLGVAAFGGALEEIAILRGEGGGGGGLGARTRVRVLRGLGRAGGDAQERADEGGGSHWRRV